MAVIFASSLLAKLLPRSLFGERCSRGKLVESRVEREVLAPSHAVLTYVWWDKAPRPAVQGLLPSFLPVADSLRSLSTLQSRAGASVRRGLHLNGSVLATLQVSQTSLLRQFRCRRAPPPRDTLLALAAAAVAAQFDKLDGDALLALPADLAQLVLDALIESGELSFLRLAAFRGQPVYRLDLGGLPAFKPEWLRLLRHAPLVCVSLRNCELVRRALGQ